MRQKSPCVQDCPDRLPCGACLGCGHEHNCDIHGCAIIREAAERIESLLMSGEENK